MHEFRRRGSGHRCGRVAQLAEQCPFNSLLYKRATRFQPDTSIQNNASRVVSFLVGRYRAVNCAVTLGREFLEISKRAGFHTFRHSVARIASC